MSSLRDEEIMRVTYCSEASNLVADVRRVDHERLCAKMKRQPDEVRAHIRRSVVDALEAAGRLVAEGITLDRYTMLNIADDVGIWFAYEVADDSASFDPLVHYRGPVRR